MKWLECIMLKWERYYYKLSRNIPTKLERSLILKKRIIEF